MSEEKSVSEPDHAVEGWLRELRFSSRALGIRRTLAARQLGGVRNYRHPDAIIQSLSHAVRYDPVERVRLEAAKSLGNLGEPSALSALVQALKDRSPAVRLQAIESLGAIRNPEALPVLSSIRQSNEPLVRSTARIAAARLGDSSAYEGLWQRLARYSSEAAPLLAQLGMEDLWRTAPAELEIKGILRFLRDHGDCTAIEPLCTLLNHAPPELSVAVALALLDIVRRHPTQEATAARDAMRRQVLISDSAQFYRNVLREIDTLLGFSLPIPTESASPETWRLPIPATPQSPTQPHPISYPDKRAECPPLELSVPDSDQSHTVTLSTIAILFCLSLVEVHWRLPHTLRHCGCSPALAGQFTRGCRP